MGQNLQVLFPKNPPMKKILGLALAAIFSLTVFSVGVFAEEGSTTDSETKTETEKTEKSEKTEKGGKKGKMKEKAESAVIDFACVGAAVAVREDAIISGFSTYSTSALSALNTRKSALASAWALTTNDEIKKAAKDAMSAYKKSLKTARKTFKDARKSAWDTYKTSVKACSGEGESLDSNGSGIDNSL